MHDKKGRSLKSNFIYSVGYNLINILAPFIITPYVARVLGATNLGTYSYFNSIAYYFVIFAMLGVGNYGNRTIASVRDSKERLSQSFWDIYYLQMILSLVTTSLYILFCVFFSTHKLVSFALLFYVVSAGLDITWFFYGVENFKFILNRNLFIKTIDLICIFIFVKSENDVGIYTLIMSLGFLVANILMWLNLKQYVDFRRPILSESIKHLKPNLVLFIPVIAISFYNFMDKIMLGTLGDMVNVGYYDNAEKIMTIPQTIVTSLGTIMLPRISNMLANGKNDAAIDYLRKSILFVAFVSSACTFGIITIAREFILVYLGKEFVDCIQLLYYLMPCLIFKAYANVFRMQYIIPKKKDKVYVVSVIVGAVVNFSLNYSLIPIYNATGACIGTICAEIIVCLYQMRYVLKEQKVGKTIVQGFGFQICGVAMYLIVSLFNFNGALGWVILQKVLIGACVYLILSGAYFGVFIRKFRRIGHA